VDALKENYTTGCGCMKKDPYLFSSTISGIGLFLFIHNLWNRSLFIHPQPLK
jgi:hypothetical protein